MKPIRWNEIYTSKWFYPLVLVFILAIIFSLRTISAIDTGFHLKGGQWMLKNLSFHKYDVFTYTVNNNKYIAMYWLFQILIYGVFKTLGYNGLTIIVMFLTLTTSFIMFLIMKERGVQVWILTISLLIAVCGTELRFLLRPELITWILLLLSVYINELYFYNKKNKLFLLPVIQLLWVNSHGLFIIGWIINLIYFLSNIFHYKKFDRILFKWILLSVLVSVLNPYFLKGITYPFYLMSLLQRKYTISELISTWEIKPKKFDPFFPGIFLYSYYLTTLFSFLLLFLTFKKRKLHDFLITFSLFYTSCMAIRNVPLFMIVAWPLIATATQDIVSSLKGKIKIIKHSKTVEFMPPLFLSIFIMCFSLRIITNAYYVDMRRTTKFGLGLDKFAHPIDAAEFLLSKGLDGRIINDLNTGSWLIWKLPQPVFIDGRLDVIREPFFREYLESHSDDGLKRLIHKYNPKILFFDISVSLRWNFQLKEMPEWRMIYFDGKAGIFAHKDYAVELPEVKFLDVVSKKGIDTTLSDQDVWNILKFPRKSKAYRWFKGFYRKVNYPYEYMSMGVFAYRNKEFRAGELLYLEFLKRTNGELFESYFNLGSLYYAKGDYRKALYCYERVLSDYPSQETAKQRLTKIKNLIF